VLWWAACILAACGGSGGGTDAPPLPTDLPDLTQPRLLSDAELTVSVKASSWEPDAATRQWLQANHTKLRSLVVDSDFSDLEPLRTQLAGRRLVLLGESSHGAREFNLAKVRLIKFMHQQLGYGVIAFESSLIGCALQDRQLQARVDSVAPATCLFPVWRTEELAELMRYIASTQTQAKPLRLAGFDWQNSSDFDEESGVRAWLNEVLASTGDAQLAASDSMLKLALKTAQDGRLCRSLGTAIDCNSFDAYRDSVQATLLRTETAMLAQAQAPGLSATQRQQRSLAALALMSLRDRVLASQIGRGIPLSSFQDREPFMAKAITRLAREVYPQDKLMIWAHNAHISAQSTGYPDSGPPMGSFLKADWGT
jgi:erythromycin esterase